MKIEDQGFLRRASNVFKDKMMGDSRRNSLQMMSGVGVIREESIVPPKVVQKELKIKFNGRFKNISLWIPLDVSESFV